MLRGFRRLLSASLLVALLAAGLPISGAALADDTPEPSSVTVVGDLQSELGCPGDWQPECAATGLVRAAHDGVWRGAFAVPAGSWEYKAALNGSWDENYGAHGVRNGPNIGLTVPAGEAGQVRFYYSHATHWVTSSRNAAIATVAGDFQSELGCPGDWQPDCLRSWLQDVDGDGTYTFSTVAIPVGSYELKVARDEGWDESYPASNVAFSVGAAGDRVTVTYRPGDGHAVAVDVRGSGSEPGDEDLALHSHRGLTDEVFYFVMPDRFADGNPANNTGGIPGGRLDHGFDPTDKGFYHGGDLAGLHAKLDYIEGLGTTAIWMTPMFANKPVQGSGEDISAGYHGYWITDFTRIDPHFGSNAELAAFVDAAHERGIKVFFDVITNHTADVISYSGGGTAYRSKADVPYRDANGTAFDDRDYAGTDTFPPLDAATSFPHVPVFPDPADATAKTPSWLNDPTLYHNRGNSTFTGESALYGDFFGLDDLFTEHPRVVEGMTEVAKDWITEFGIDGFRVDTVKHVNDEFWDAWVPEVEAHAAAEGIEDFFVFGEVFDGNPSFTSRYTRDGAFPSVLDFPFQGRASSFAATGAATDGLRDLFADDDYYTRSDGNAYSLTTFLGNHDIGRIGGLIAGSNPGASDAAQLQRSILGHELAFTARGMPVVYYGDEQGFTGAGGDKDARQDMFPSKTPSYMSENQIGTTATPADDNFDGNHPLYGAIAELAELRAAHPALASGAQIHRLSGDSAGVYAFSRIDRTEQVEYVVALNNATSARTATIPTYSAGTTFTEVYPGEAGSATTTATAALELTVPALSAVVYRAARALPPSEAAPGITVSAPQRGSEVSGLTELGATLSTGEFAEVTFAVRTGAEEDWTVVGTDDNAPYRVFLDTARFPVGTPLQVKAVVRDRSGNIASATSAATVVAGPDQEPPGGSRDYAVVHYQRTTGDIDDWGLHLWGDVDDSEIRDWGDPKPFQGETDYGRFAWIKLKPDASEVGFIVYDGQTKDVEADRTYDPNAMPEVWLRQGDPTIYTSQAQAQGYVELRYRRPAGDYGDYGSSDYNDFWGLHLWGDGLAPGVPTDWTAPRKPDRIDGDGAAVFRIPLADAAEPVNVIVHRGDTKDTDADRAFDPLAVPTPWVVQGDATVHASRGSALQLAVLHYHRPAGDYGDHTSTNFNDYWGLHTWGVAADPGWTTPRKPVRTDGFGIVFEVPIVNAGTEMGYILHRGDAKDLPEDQSLDLATIGHEVWILSGREGYLLPVTGARADADLRKQRAHWIDGRTIAWGVEHRAGQSYALVHDPEARIAVEGTVLSGGGRRGLERLPGGLTEAQRARFPHLAGLSAFEVPEGVDTAALLREQLVVAAFAGDDLTAATGVQIPGVVDDRYAAAAEDIPLGAVVSDGVPTLRLWAPTARSVRLHRFSGPRGGEAAVTDLALDAASGVWSVTGQPDWVGDYYLYEVEVYVPTTGTIETNLVTDPYSLALAANSTRSQIVALDAPGLVPPGWSALTKPPLVDHADASIYELHVRDFSIFDATVPAAHRGTFKAFTHRGSNGMRHLAALADAGMTHLHLLPIFDLATVDEDPANRSEPDYDVLAALPPDSEEQQAIVSANADRDGFNWGYDPWHYTVPEGSYATGRDGSARTREFREMVAAINRADLRVVVDVVYNHMNAAGQAEKSVLDRIVPGYYHRLLEDGAVAQSTCCPNTATEHAMMERLMVDSVVTWAREYKVDGFRFDLMGHHSKANMLAVRAALDALTPEADGVDGKAIVLYGEGWNFGEVADDARFVQATQANMTGTGIGTFNDRLRDAVRGGGPFDDDPRHQGFGSGMFTAPNGAPQGTPEQQRARLLHQADLVRVGLAGNLSEYRFTDRTGATVTGAQVDYNGSPAGYTAIPHEAVNYVSKHDNETLFDALALKLPQATTMADRVRMQALSLSTVALSQGMPFFHAGSDLLRSKSLDRNSYDSGDWFNRLDWTYAHNNFGVGLPPARDNSSKWDFMRPLLADPAVQADRSAIERSAALFRELLAIRSSSPLFRLGDANQVAERLTFANTGPDQIPGVIAMRLSDEGEERLDPTHRNIVVVFNATPDAHTVPVDGTAGVDYRLHRVQAASADPTVRTASFTAGAFTVPARTTAVFVELRPRPPGPPKPPQPGNPNPGPPDGPPGNPNPGPPGGPPGHPEPGPA